MNQHTEDDLEANFRLKYRYSFRVSSVHYFLRISFLIFLLKPTNEQLCPLCTYSYVNILLYHLCLVISNANLMSRQNQKQKLQSDGLHPNVAFIVGFVLFFKNQYLYLEGFLKPLSGSVSDLLGFTEQRKTVILMVIVYYIKRIKD